MDVLEEARRKTEGTLADQNGTPHLGKGVPPPELSPQDVAILKATAKAQREMSCMRAIEQAVQQFGCKLICEHTFGGENKVNYRVVAT